MQQREPGIPVTSAAVLPALQSSHGAPWLRLLATFVLGLISSVLFSPVSGGPWWWQQVLAVLVSAVLCVAVLLSQVRARGGVLAVGVVIGSLEVVILVLRQIVLSSQATGVVAVNLSLVWGALVPILVGLASAFVAQRQPRVFLALRGAALGWLATSMLNLIVVLYSPNWSAEGGIGEGLSIFAFSSFIGLVLALVGGLLGWGLRAFTVRNTA